MIANSLLFSLLSLPLQVSANSPVRKCKTFNPSGPLVKQSGSHKVNVPENYKLSFTLKPTGTVADWSSIMHFTGDNENILKNSRIPGIW